MTAKLVNAVENAQIGRYVSDRGARIAYLPDRTHLGGMLRRAIRGAPPPGTVHEPRLRRRDAAPIRPPPWRCDFVREKHFGREGIPARGTLTRRPPVLQCKKAIIPYLKGLYHPSQTLSPPTSSPPKKSFFPILRHALPSTYKPALLRRLRRRRRHGTETEDTLAPFDHRVTNGRWAIATSLLGD
jgi:hypothetical protein